MKVLILLLFSSAWLSAQFTSLSTDFSGSTLFFTADFAQVETDQPTFGKVFIADSDGIRPLLIRPREVTPINVFQPGILTNYYDFLGVDIASNSSRIAVTAYHECTVTSEFCKYMDGSDVYDEQGQYMFSANGYVSFSPNGLWALVVGVSAALPDTHVSVIEISTGAEYTLPVMLGNRYWRQHKVANNGTVVTVLLNGGVQVFQPQGAVRVIPGNLGGWAVIDALGSNVVWEEADLTGSYFRVWKVGSASPASSLRVPGRNDDAPKISDDGALVLFLSRPQSADDPQVFSMHLDGTERRQVTAITEGVTAAILSGNGSVAWAVTRTGRLLKIDVASGAQQEFIGPTAAFNSPVHCDGSFGGPRWSGAPGEVITIPASVMPGEAVEIHVGPEQAIVTDVGVQRVSFRIPGTLSLGSRPEVTISKPGGPRWIARPITLSIGGGDSSSTCTGIL